MTPESRRSPPRALARGWRAGAAACLLAACSPAEASRTAEPPAPAAASPEFDAHFALAGRVRAVMPARPLAPGADTGQRPLLCTAGARGDVYLARSAVPRLALWPAGAARVRPLPLPADAALGAPVALFWSADRETLYVLDGGKRQVRRYGPEGEPRGYAAINGGQTVFTLAVVGDRLLTGGIRWETPEHATLLSLHDAQGRQERTFMEMDPGMRESELFVSPPVLFAGTGAGAALVAEPVSPRVSRVDEQGRMAPLLDASFAGYRAPTPVRDAQTVQNAEGWTRSWDRLVFLHQGDRHVFAAFQTWRGGRRGYRLEVFTPDGRRVATGLRHDALPLCGSGDELVLAAEQGDETVELSRYRYTGPGAAGHPAPPARSDGT